MGFRPSRLFLEDEQLSLFILGGAGSMTGFPCLVAGVRGEKIEPCWAESGELLSPADHFAAAGVLRVVAADCLEAGDLPELIGFEAFSTHRLNCHLTSAASILRCSCDEREAVVTALGVEVNRGLRDRAEGDVPLECITSEQV